MNLGGFSLDNILGALENQKTGVLAGFLLNEYQLSKDWNQDFLFVIQNQVTHLLTNPHLPKLDDVLMEITGGTPSLIFKPAANAAIIGWILKELKLHPMLTKYAGKASTIGINFAIASVIQAAWLHSTVLNSPSTREAAMYDRVTAPSRERRLESPYLTY